MSNLTETDLILLIKISWLFSIGLMLLETMFLKKSIQHIWGLSKYKFTLIYAGVGLGSLLFVTIAFQLWLGSLLILIFLYMNYQFHGSFNGGSCLIQLSVLTGLVLTTYNPKLGLLWIGVQGILSYWIAGLAKLKERNWYSGFALKTFMQQSPYSQSKYQQWLDKHQLWGVLSKVTLLWEGLFPLILWLPDLYFLVFGFMVFIFHLHNAWFFGLNRFTWSWLSIWPGIWYLAQNFNFK